MEERNLSGEEIRVAKLALTLGLALVFALGISFFTGVLVAQTSIETVVCQMR